MLSSGVICFSVCIKGEKNQTPSMFMLGADPSMTIVFCAVSCEIFKKVPFVQCHSFPF